jgi:hypothetical protein
MFRRVIRVRLRVGWFSAARLPLLADLDTVEEMMPKHDGRASQAGAQEANRSQRIDDDARRPVGRIERVKMKQTSDANKGDGQQRRSGRPQAEIPLQRSMPLRHAPSLSKVAVQLSGAA